DRALPGASDVLRAESDGEGSRRRRWTALLDRSGAARQPACGDSGSLSSALSAAAERLHLVRETAIARQDAGAIHHFTPCRSSEDDRGRAGTREQAHPARLRRVYRLGHDRLDDPSVTISRHVQQAADHLCRARGPEELLLAVPHGRVLEREPARA